MAVVGCLALFATLALAAPDWTDCPEPCYCKWTSGKKTALCKQAGFTAIPANLDSEMQVLDLTGNTIDRLPVDAFKTAGLGNLQRVFLGRCGVVEVHRDAFRDLTILVEVDLSHNAIASLHPDTFQGNERLRILYLNDNPLRRLAAAQFPYLGHLRILDLSHCRLEAMHREAFVRLKALESLNISYNQLQRISEEVFMGAAQLKTLLLDGNPWRCDCELRGFRDWLLEGKLYSVELSCAEPARVAGRTWAQLVSREFACAPRVSVWPPQQQVQAEAGGNVSFGCRVTGDPEPQVSWLYEGRPINHTWLVLEAEEGLLSKWANISVYNASEVDAGVYTCVASNPLDSATANLTLVLPEVVTATTLSKAGGAAGLLWWGLAAAAALATLGTTAALAAVCCARSRARRRRRRRNMKASVSFTDQEKKLLDVSIATTTDRGAGSCEALGPDLDALDPPVHITIESEPLSVAMFPPPPPQFSGAQLPPAPFGNIFISVSVSRDPVSVAAAAAEAAARCPDLLDLPHRAKTAAVGFHGLATLPRRPPPPPAPHYDNMGPRVTAGGSSTLSLPDCEAAAAAPAAAQLPPPPPPIRITAPLTPDFVSL